MTIIAQQSDHILTLTMNRFEKKNALTQDMYLQLDQQLKIAIADDEIHVVVIKGNEACFSAGNDLKDFMSSGLDDSPVIPFLHQLANFPKVIVAAVAGPAIGIGTTMLLHCDHVVAADNSHFQMPFSQLGLCPEAGSSLLLGNMCGQRVATELLVLGAAFNSERAQQLGIINQSVGAEQLMETTQQVATAYARLPLQSTIAGKKLIKAEYLASLHQKIDDEAAVFSELLATETCQNTIAKFFAK